MDLKGFVQKVLKLHFALLFKGDFSVFDRLEIDPFPINGATASLTCVRGA